VSENSWKDMKKKKKRIQSLLANYVRKPIFFHSAYFFRVGGGMSVPYLGGGRRGDAM